MALRTLYQTLLDSELARLQVIARLWEIPLTAARRTDIAAELADAMTRAEAVQRAWEQLAPDQQAALEDLLRREGAQPWAAFARRWGQIRSIGPARLEREELWRTPISPAEGLWYHGFLQRAYEDQPTGSVEMAFVPEELRLYLPAPPPLATPPPPPTAPPAVWQAQGERAAEDLVRLAAYLQTETIKPSTEGQLTERHRERLGRHLHTAEPSYLALLETLALEQGWIEATQGLLRPAAAPWLAWLQAGRWPQWLALARAWETSRQWNDLAQVATLHLPGEAPWPNRPQPARARFLEVLRRCTPGVWYLIAEFSGYVKEQTPDFLRPDGDYDLWNLHDRLTDAPLRGFAAWEAVEGALLDFYLRGPLAWLGLLDLGSPTPTLPPDRFRLTAAGAAWLGLASAPDLPAPAPIELRADGSLRVPTGRHYERFQLSRIAQPIPGDPQRYRLTPRALNTGKQQRIPLQRVLEFLEEATGNPLPEALCAAISQAYQGAAPASLERLWILRVREPALLDSPGLRRFIQERLSPHAALVRRADRERVIAQLAQQGLLPDVEEQEYN